MRSDFPDAPTPVRLPGGWSLPPFGQPQWLALLVVAIAMWATSALWVGLQSVLQWAGTLQPEIHFYLPPGQPQQQQALIAALKQIEQVKRVDRVSRAETDAWLKRWLGGTPVAGDILPDTIRVTLSGNGDFLQEDLHDIAARFHASVNDEEFALLHARDRLTLASNILLGCGVVLMIGMALIVTNTLRLSLLAREDELSLMRLLGADEWFVQLPFLLEGGVIGAGAGALALVLQLPLLAALRALGLTPPSFAHLILPLLAAGVIVGFAGAVVAVRVRSA